MLRDLCRWFYERKDYPAALPWCRSYAALEASPATQLLLANALTGASNLSEALDLLRMLIEGNQTQVSGQAYFLLGEIQRRQGDYQAALSAYEQSLETGYAHLWVLISLANTYRQLGDMPKACEVYAAALQSGYTADTQNQSNFLDCGK
jgi:tetratricopeptide (TPR) repeat protein